MNHKKELQHILETLLSKDLLQNPGDFLAMRTDAGLISTDIEARPKEISLLNIHELVTEKYLDIFKIKDTNFLLKTSAKFIGTVAKSGKYLPPVLDDMAQILGPVVKNVSNANDKLVFKILKRHGVVLLDTGAAIIIASSLDELINKALILDKVCTIYVCSSVLGGAKPLPKFDAYLMNFIYKYIYSKLNTRNDKAKTKAPKFNYSPSEKAIELGKKLKKYGEQLVSENLVQRTWGNASIRMDDKTFVATPSGIEYSRLQPEQCTLIEIDRSDNWQGVLKPTTEKKLHAQILKTYPDIQAVIHSHPIYACVFAACKMDLSLTDAEEIHQLNSNKIKTTEYGIPGSNKIANNAAIALNNKVKACILQNHGVVAVGTSIDEAFKNLKYLEFAAMRAIEIKIEEQSGRPYNKQDLVEYFSNWVKNKR